MHAARSIATKGLTHQIRRSDVYVLELFAIFRSTGLAIVAVGFPELERPVQMQGGKAGGWVRNGGGVAKESDRDVHLCRQRET